GHVRGFAPGTADLEGEHVVGIEAGIDAGKLLEAAKKKAGTDEQGDGESDLHRDEEPLNSSASGDLIAAARGERMGESPAGSAESREEPAEEGCGRGGDQRVGH